MNLLTPGFGLLIWTLLAFLVVFFLLAKFAWPAIINGLREREHSIASSLETAKRVQAEMAQLKSENEALLAKAREERAQLLKEARETKDRIIAEAKDQAKSEANKIMAETQAAIQAQQMAALTEVKQIEKGSPQYRSWTFLEGGRYKDNGPVSEEELSILLKKGYKEYIPHVWVDRKGSNTWVVDEVNVDKAWLIRKLNRIHQEKGGQPNLIDVKKGSKLPFQDIIKIFYA